MLVSMSTKKYNTIWDQVSTDIKNKFDREPVNKNLLTTKIKFHGDDVKDFYKKEIPN